MKGIRKYALTAASIFMFATTFVYADTVAVVLIDPGSVSDGVDYVSPYQITINGAPFSATCYDYYDQVQVNEQWTANELTLTEAADSGAFSGPAFNAGSTALTDYEEVAWLSSETTLTEQSQIDLQHVIWDIFDPGTFTVNNGMQTWVTAWGDAYNAGFAPSFFDNYVFLEGSDGTPGNGSFPQTFVIGTGNTDANPSTPEADSITLLAIGLVMISISKVFRA